MRRLGRSGRALHARIWQVHNASLVRFPPNVEVRPSTDRSRNMWEPCEDWWDPDYFKSSPPKDPPGPKTGRARVERGGSWDSSWVALSAAKRNFVYTGYREGDFGFRCASEPPR